MPRRIKEAAKGDMRKQRDKHTAWLRWREEFDIANIFDTPKPAFEVIKVGVWCKLELVFDPYELERRLVSKS